MVSKAFDRVGEQQTDEEIAHGLPVIIYARWVLVVAGIALALWNPANLLELEVAVVLILVLAVANFFLHVELVKKKKVDRRIVYAMSAADLIAITAVIFSTGTFGGGSFAFYLPALLAISVTFRTSDTAVFTVVTAIAYGAFGAVADVADSLAVEDGRSAALISHVLMLVAVPVCGNIYWRLERKRRSREDELERVKQTIVEAGSEVNVTTNDRTPVGVRNA